VTEIIQLDANYWGIVDQLMNAQINSEAGVRFGSFENAASHAVPIYFSNRFARNWWQQVRNGFKNSEYTEFLRVVDDAFSSMNEAEDSNKYEDMQRKLSIQLGASTNE
jgi:hypothetical protein